MPRDKKALGYGAAGGRRDTAARSAKQVTRRRNRENDPRYKAAMEEVRANEARLRELDERVSTIGETNADALRKSILAERDKAQAVADKVTAEVEAAPEQPWFHCPRCGRSSRVPEALEEGYCSFCVDWTGDPVVKVRKLKKKFDTSKLPYEGDGNGTTPLVLARSRLRHGYNLKTIIEQTGFGFKHFEDCEWDENGYGIDWLEK